MSSKKITEFFWLAHRNQFWLCEILQGCDYEVKCNPFLCVQDLKTCVEV